MVMQSKVRKKRGWLVIKEIFGDSEFFDKQVQHGCPIQMLSCLINGNGGDSLNYMDGGFLMHGDGGGDGRLR